MEKEININIDLEDQQYNIKNSINNFLRSIDFSKDNKSDFIPERIKIVFVSGGKDVTSEWESRDSYKMIKDIVAKIIALQFEHYNLFKNKFTEFEKTITEIIKR